MWCTQIFFLEWFNVSVFVQPRRYVRLYLSFCEPHTGHCQVNRQAAGFGTGAKWLPLGADKAFRPDKVRLQKGSFINDLIQIWASLTSLPPCLIYLYHNIAILPFIICITSFMNGPKAIPLSRPLTQLRILFRCF